MDGQQEQQRQDETANLGNNAEAGQRQGAYDPTAENAARNANQQNHEEAAKTDPTGTNRTPEQQKQDEEEKAKQQRNAEAAQQQGAGKTGILGRIEHGAEHLTGVEAFERHERRRKAFNEAKAGPIGKAVDDINSFLQAMDDCQAETPEAMLADSDVQQAAVRAREGLKVFTGDTPVTFSKPTSDAHLNVGSGGAVTGNTKANLERAAAVRELHGDPVTTAKAEDDEAELATAGTKVPQPDAHVR